MASPGNLADTDTDGGRGESVSLLGIKLDNLTYDQTLEQLRHFCQQRECRQVNFVNAHCANVAQKDPAYLDILHRSALCLADGSGVRLGARLLGQTVVENVNGTDLFPRLCEQLQHSQGSLALLGAKPGIAQAVADWVGSRYPSVHVRFVADGYFSDHDEAALVQRIADCDCDVLLVALGVPGQEKWLDRNREALKVGAALAVGGLFDFYSGSIPRAPLWLRELGMEWTFRLYQEPLRLWRRYVLGNVVFLSYVFREKWRKSSS
jgi:N-acetylglucosaminyldiphosphoundecaprenol N-acetyl-beta-D-mannosaminyltransferase